MVRRTLLAVWIILVTAGMSVSVVAAGERESLPGTREAMEQSGIVGVWSTNCLDKPESGHVGANRTVYAVPASGFPTRVETSVIMADGHRDEISKTFEILAVKRVTTSEVAMKILPVREALTPFSQLGALPYNMAVPEKSRIEYIVVDKVLPDKIRGIDYFAMDGSVTMEKNGILWVPYVVKPTPWPGIIKWRSSGKETPFAERCLD